MIVGGVDAPTMRLPDGSEVALDAPIVVGRNPLAPPGVPSAVPVRILRDLSVSKTHALIEWDGTHIWVTDLHSSNGTDVMESSGQIRSLGPGSRTPVDVGAKLVVGSVDALAFRAAPVVVATPAPVASRPVPMIEAGVLVAAAELGSSPGLQVLATGQSWPVSNPVPVFVPYEGGVAPAADAYDRLPAPPPPHVGSPDNQIGTDRHNSQIVRRRLAAGLLAGWAAVALIMIIGRDRFGWDVSSIPAKLVYFPSGYVDLIVVDSVGKWSAIFPLLVVVSALLVLTSPGSPANFWLCVGAALSSIVVLLVVLYRPWDYGVGVVKELLPFLVLPVVGLIVLFSAPSVGSGANQTVALATTAGQSVAPVHSRPTLPLVPLPLGTRMGAYLIDLVLVVVTLGIGWLIWSILLWKDGQSPGKKMVGAVVVNRTTGQVADAGTMAIREFVGKGMIGLMTLGITGMVSGFMVLFGQQHRTVHDNVAGTIVVSASAPGVNVGAPPPPPAAPAPVPW